MTTSSEDLVKPTANTVPSPHTKRHRFRQRKKIAAQIVLILALVIGLLAISDFVYNAYIRADCYTAEQTDEWGNTTPAMPKSEACYAEISRRDELLRMDAAAAMVAVAVVLGATIVSRGLRKHRR